MGKCPIHQEVKVLYVSLWFFGFGRLNEISFLRIDTLIKRCSTFLAYHDMLNLLHMYEHVCKGMCPEQCEYT